MTFRFCQRAGAVAPDEVSREIHRTPPSHGPRRSTRKRRIWRFCPRTTCDRQRCTWRVRVQRGNGRVGHCGMGKNAENNEGHLVLLFIYSRFEWYMCFCPLNLYHPHILSWCTPSSSSSSSSSSWPKVQTRVTFDEETEACQRLTSSFEGRWFHWNWILGSMPYSVQRTKHVMGFHLNSFAWFGKRRIRLWPKLRTHFKDVPRTGVVAGISWKLIGLVFFWSPNEPKNDDRGSHCCCWRLCWMFLCWNHHKKVTGFESMFVVTSPIGHVTIIKVLVVTGGNPNVPRCFCGLSGPRSGIQTRV